MLSWTSRRDPAMQVWPVAAKIPDTAPLTASSILASAKTMFGDLPPSSKVTRLKVFAASSLIARPVASEPVNAIFRTSGWPTNAVPTSLPNPVTTLTTPGGNPASSTSLTNSSVDAEVNSEGLTTTVQPAASAGASFQASSNSGEFQAVIAATTPTGSLRV